MDAFRFKQFTVDDEQCAMKVGTDAVLLGAWCEVGDAKRILDIGTGSGVIALMMAQRSMPDSKIDAVEILQSDTAQAQSNFRNSPWPTKVHVIQARIQDHHPAYLYDLIVCNPPYFSKSQLPPHQDREKVRHGTTLSLKDLIGSADRLLAPWGQFHLILPTTESILFKEEAIRHHLYLKKLTRFFSRPEKPQERSLMTFHRQAGTCKEDSLYLYETEEIKTAAYRELTREFYL